MDVAEKFDEWNVQLWSFHTLSADVYHQKFTTFPNSNFILLTFNLYRMTNQENFNKILILFAIVKEG